MRFVLVPIRLLSLFVLGAALLSAGPVRGQDVRVTVIAVLATTDKNAPVEKEVAALATAIRDKNPEYYGFRRGVMATLPIAIDSEGTFVVDDRQTVTVAILQGMDKKEKIRVRVKPPLLGEITMNCCCNKFVPFMTPYDTKEKKERLIIAVMISTCPGK
jgi:hypothetical protein